MRAEATADIDFAQVDHRRRNVQAELAAGAAGDPQPADLGASSGRRRAPASGVPGALSNQPPGAATAPLRRRRGAAAGAADRRTGPSRKDATTNYEVDKTIRYEQRPMGGIKRLTVGVVVNYRRSVDPRTGKVTVKPLAAAEVEQINELVKQAMGYRRSAATR